MSEVQFSAPMSKKHLVMWVKPPQTRKTKEDEIDDLVCAPCQRKDMMSPCGRISTEWKRCMLMVGKEVAGYTWDQCMELAYNLSECIVKHPDDYPLELETAQQVIAARQKPSAPASD